MLCIAFRMPCLFTYLLFSFYGLKGTLDKCNFTVLALRCFILECKFCLVLLMRELFNLTWIMYFPSLFLFKLCLLFFFSISLLVLSSYLMYCKVLCTVPWFQHGPYSDSEYPVSSPFWSSWTIGKKKIFTVCSAK